MTYRPYWILAPLALAGIAPFQAALAQTSQADLVRPLGAADLNTNLARLASNPRDVGALIGAGEAALALDDPRAATGFFARADAIQSSNGRIKAGLGRVMVKLQNPVEALRLFDQAVRLGYPTTSFLSDRGLARDMTGDQANAQRDYQAALQQSPQDAELLRRYAASLGISGQIEASDKVLQPLLYKSDRAAWRYRAFILAMNNRQADAKKIAAQTLPAQMVASLTPYMQKMPYLTAAQKAAAVHFGHFPTTVGTTIAAVAPTVPAAGMHGTNVGGPASAPPVASTQPAERETASTRRRDRAARRAETALARKQAQSVARASATTSVPTRAYPSAPANPVASSAENRGPSSSNPVAATVQPTPGVPASPTIQPLPTGAREAVRMAEARTPPPASTSPSPSGAVQPMPGQTRPSPAPVQSSPSVSTVRPGGPVQGPPAPGFDALDGGGVVKQPVPTAAPAQHAEAVSIPRSTVVRPAPTTMAAASAQAPAPLPNPDLAATRTLADIIHAIDVPDSERQSSVAAVDLGKIEALQTARRATRLAAAGKVKKAAAAKVKAEADAKAKAEAAEKARLAANPSRNWLQISTGASQSALSFTLNRLRKKYPDLAPQDAWIATWGRTNRLVVGPFASFARAQALEKSLKADGADVFAWKSDAGEDVTRLK